MLNQYEVKHAKMTSGRLGVAVPFNAEFNSELKARVATVKFSRPYWTYDPAEKDTVTELVQRYYIDVQWMRVELDLNRDIPTVDGCKLAYVSRDNYTWKSDMLMRVDVDEVKSGGSRANPGLYGRAVLQILMRPNAVVSPEPVSVEAIGESESEHPLAAFRIEDLIAELQRREKEVMAAGWSLSEVTNG